MATVSEVLGGKAAPHLFDHEGKRYKVGLITQSVKSNFERWLIDRALAAAGENARAISIVTRDAAKGAYSYHGDVAAESWQGQDGIVKLTSLLFGTSEEEMAKLLLARPVEVKGLLKVVILESTAEEHRDKVLAEMEKAERGEGDIPNG